MNKKQHRRILAWRILGIVILFIGILFLLADLSRGVLSAAEFVFIGIGLVSLSTSWRLKKIYTHPINTTTSQTPGLQPNPENATAGVGSDAESNLSSTTVASAQPQKPSQPAEVSAPASLLKNMTLLGSKKGSLKLTPNRLTFISSKNIALMDYPLAEIVCQNKIFPFAYFQVSAPDKTYKYYFGGMNNNAATSYVNGEQLLQLITQYQTPPAVTSPVTTS